jgi:hypothetical protein
MARNGEPFDSFREGMSAGHDAGRSRDLLYAAGFITGFIWGFITSARRSEARPFGRVNRTA